METYLVLWKWTEPGAKAVNETVARAEAVKSDIQSRGGKVKEFRWTLGQWDGFLVAEVEDAQVLTAALLKVAGGGNVRTQALRAFDEQEMQQILKKV
ncbi:MAG: GYD domain-containing protein [Dehalococcoidia bacterium]|jgi:uncharacterized protein with GYD domain